MSIYDDLQSVVQGVMADFKQGVIEYGAVTTGGGSVDDPGASSVAWTTLAGAVANGVSAYYVTAGLALASDKQVTMAVQAGVTPRLKDLIRIDGVQYKITRVMTKPEAGTPVAYVLFVQR